MPELAASLAGTTVSKTLYPCATGRGPPALAYRTSEVLSHNAVLSATKAEPRNRLLAALPPEDLARLRPHLDPVSLLRGRVLFDAEEPSNRVYFPATAVISTVCTFEDGTTSEMATVGREGVVGLAAFLDADSPLDILLDGDATLGHCLVLGSGLVLAMERARFRSALRESQALRAVCLAYAQVFFTQALQAVACNAVHTAEQRCARWLLMSHDRSEGDTFALTQELLATMLGVRRSTVTDIAGALQGAGLIRYRRGAITVLDPEGLEAASCGCYRLIRDRYERLLPHPTRSW